MRLIDADSYCENICRCNKERCDKGKCPVHNAPTIEATTVVYGRWIETEDKEHGRWNYDCSECGDGYASPAPFIELPNFCGNCGVYMKKGGAE